ncbi:MAG TPA: PaaI family thioesterase [Candidatus Eisenbacteria bacterium]|nr:PaaI family thioesterase [Candidatus Eisenbacteria bacterium]
MPDRPPLDPEELRAQWKAGWDAAMGFRYVRATRDEVVVEYDVGPVHRQPYGIVHGGVHCGVVEAVCSTGAAMDAMARGQSVVGLENHTSFVRAVREGKITITAKPITRGRRVQLWEATSRDEAGRIVSTGRVRLLCLDPGTELAGETVREMPTKPKAP